MFKKVFNFVTAPVRFIVAVCVMIHVALVLAFDEEQARQYDYDMGCGEIE